MVTSHTLIVENVLARVTSRALRDLPLGIGEHLRERGNMEDDSGFYGTRAEQSRTPVPWAAPLVDEECLQRLREGHRIADGDANYTHDRT